MGLLWAAPSAALATTVPLIVVGAAAFIGGIVSEIHGTLWTTTVQQRIPAEAMSRVNSLVVVGAFSVGPIGLALAGPLADATSVAAVLAVGVGWHVLASAVLLTTSAIRDVRSEVPRIVTTGPSGSSEQGRELDRPPRPQHTKQSATEPMAPTVAPGSQP